MEQKQLARKLSSICECEHFVQLYANDEELVHNLKSFIGGGMVAGDPCIVIATTGHKKALDKKLLEAGLNVKALKETGMYVYLDAHETLNEFMVNGMPDGETFKEHIGKLLSSMPVQDKVIRSYGEMVAILWEQGNRAAALKLEQLWNELSKEYSFTLFCGYPKSYFQQSIDETRVSLLHTTTVLA